MTFELIHADPTPFSGSVLVALLWALPAMALAIRSLVSVASLRRHLLVVVLGVSAGAIVPTLAVFDVIRWDSDLWAAGLLGYACSVALACLAFILLRAAERRRALR